MKSTFAWIHARHQHEPRRIVYAEARAADRDAPFLDGLPQHLQDLSSELRELIEKEHPVVCQRDFARERIASSAAHPGIRNSVMRCSKRPDDDEAGPIQM